MRTALILAAGVGKRLGSQGERLPKCLLTFDGCSLLKRHIQILASCGVDEAVVAVGYRRELIEAEIASIRTTMSVTTVYNPDYHLGSILTLDKLLQSRPKDAEDILLMDADVLYDHRMISRLLTSINDNCFLLDCDFEPGDEPVKLCVRGGELVEFRKKVNVACDYSGESVGFFRFSPKVTEMLHRTTRVYIRKGKTEEPYEEAIREVLLSGPDQFGFEDITGLPWIEVDFQEDLERAKSAILPRLIELGEKWSDGVME